MTGQPPARRNDHAGRHQAQGHRDDFEQPSVRTEIAGADPAGATLPGIDVGLRGLIEEPGAAPGPDAAESPRNAGSLEPAGDLAADGPERTTVDDVSGMKTARTGGVVRAGAIMAIATLVSRATGFLAKVVIVSVLGFGMVNDAYTLANTLPNIIFELLIGGVLTSVAIPLLSRARADPDGGEGYTQRLVTVAFVGLLIATALAVAAVPLITRLYLTGGDGKVDQDLANTLAYLLMPQIFFYGMAALFGAILNTKENFAVPAWAPVANNLVVIGVGVALSILTMQAGDIGGALTSLSREQYLLLGLGTTAGIVTQALVMVPSLIRGGFRFRWRWGGDRRLLEAGALTLWAIAYVLVSQVGYVVVTRVASANVEGGISLYAYASMLFQLPYGIIGVSILTAIMPRMSRHAAAGQMDRVKDDAGLANRLSIVSLVPISAGMVVLAGALAVASSLYGNVGVDDTMVLGTTLAALALGLVPFAVTLVQMRVFYAMKDARTPTLINAIMVAVRVPLLIASASLDAQLIIPGMAVATSISYLVGAISGEIWLRTRYGPMGTRRTLVTLVKMTVAGAAGAGAAYLVGDRLIDIDVTNLVDAIVQILISGAIGLIVIGLVALALRVEELAPVRRRVMAILRRGKPPAPPGPGDAGSPAGQPDPRDTPTGPDPGQASDSRADTVTGDVAGPDPQRAGAPPSPGVSHAADGPDRGTFGEASTDHPAGHDPATAPLGRAGFPSPQGAIGRDPIAGVPAPTHTSREQVTDSVPTDSVRAAARTASDDRGSTEPAPGGATSTLPGVTVPPARPLNPGTLVGGRYRLVTLVSTDGAGHWFWRAKDNVLPRDMAVTMLPDTTGTSATVARTLRAGRLYHIGLPQTLDVGTDHGQSYVVGQWVDGATVTDLLSAGPLDPDVATSITAKVSEAVAEAHRNGIALGAINPSLVRVNFDGQVRLSHVIAHGAATPEQDIRAIGAMLYLMLTGTWPLSEPLDQVTSVAATSASARAAAVPAAPTRLGREVPAAEVRPEVPEALSALAERALHPDEPDGIHAVGAIAALLRSPESAGGAAPAPEPSLQRPITAADRRLIRERRVKLSLAAVVLTVLAVLIVITIGGLTNQFTASIQNSAPDQTEMIDSTQPATGASPTTADATQGESSTDASGRRTVKAVAGLVYDPEGDGNPDYRAYVDRAFDGNPESAWLTWVYKQQFPTFKSGVGLVVELEEAVSPTAVRLISDTPGTQVEIRSIEGPSPRQLAAAKPLAEGTVKDGGVTIDLTNAPTSKHLMIWVKALSPTPDKQFQSKINEIIVETG